MKLPRNIIIIVVDALRAANLGCYGYPFNTSPNIDKLAVESVVFEDAFACSVKTDPAFTSIASGLYPTTHGIINHANKIKPEELTRIDELTFLAEALKQNGYKCFGLDFLGRWHRRGFDYYLGMEKSPKARRVQTIDFLRKIFNINPGTKIQKVLEKTPIYNIFLKLLFSNKSTPYLAADKLTDKAIEILEKDNAEHKFIFIHFWDPHKPYWPPQRYINQLDNADYAKLYPCADKPLSEIRETFCSPLGRFFFDQMSYGKSKAEDLIRAYDGEIKFMDDNLGRILPYISEDDLLIFTADHGETLTEHDIYFTHEELYRPTLHIPFILKSAQFEPQKIRGFIQPVDILPTIIDLVGADFNKPLDGKSVRLLIEGKPLRDKAFAIDPSALMKQAAVFTERYKYIAPMKGYDNKCEFCNCVHSSGEMLFDLINDPQESKNIFRDSPEIAEKYKTFLETFFQGQPASEGKAKGAKWSKAEDEEIKKQLEKLGYF